MTDTIFTEADLDRPRFTRPQAAAITGLSDGQLKGILDRRLVRLRTHNPGSGRSRLFSLSNLVGIAVARSMARVGVPMRLFSECAAEVEDSLRSLFDRNRGQSIVVTLPRNVRKEEPPTFGRHLMLYPGPRDGEWLVKTMFIDDQNHMLDPKPWSFVLLDIDELILETLRNAASYIADRQRES